MKVAINASVILSIGQTVIQTPDKRSAAGQLQYQADDTNRTQNPFQTSVSLRHKDEARDCTRASTLPSHPSLSNIIPVEHQIARGAAANVGHVVPRFAFTRGHHRVLAGQQLHIHQRARLAKRKYGLP